MIIITDIISFGMPLNRPDSPLSKGPKLSTYAKLFLIPIMVMTEVVYTLIILKYLLSDLLIYSLLNQFKLSKKKKKIRIYVFIHFSAGVHYTFVITALKEIYFDSPFFNFEISIIVKIK